MSSSKPATFAVAGIVAVAVAFGAYALGNSNSGNGTSGAASAAQPGAGRFPGNRNGNAPPGFGAPVTGATADKVKAAALARYKGTVEQVMKLDDGSYVVHVLTANSEYHVHVSKDFTVTGVDQGGPGAGGPPGAAPQGAVPRPGTTS
jgi:hypothetical protein